MGCDGARRHRWPDGDLGERRAGQPPPQRAQRDTAVQERIRSAGAPWTRQTRAQRDARGTPPGGSRKAIGATAALP